MQNAVFYDTTQMFTCINELLNKMVTNEVGGFQNDVSMNEKQIHEVEEIL